MGFQFLEGQASWVGESILPEHLISFLHYCCLFRKKSFTFFSCKKQTVDLLFQIPISINELFHSVSLLNKSLFLNKLVICLSWNMRRLHKTDSFTAYCTFSTNEGHHYCFCLHQHYHLSPIIVSAYILSS